MARATAVGRDTARVTSDPLLTVAELREVLTLQEALLPHAAGDADRLDLYELLADLYRRLDDAQSRHLAAAAGLGAWHASTGRDVLLAPRLLSPVLRNLDRLTAASTDQDLVDRAAQAGLLLGPGRR